MSLSSSSSGDNEGNFENDVAMGGAATRRTRHTAMTGPGENAAGILCLSFKRGLRGE